MTAANHGPAAGPDGARGTKQQRSASATVLAAVTLVGLILTVGGCSAPATAPAEEPQSSAAPEAPAVSEPAEGAPAEAEAVRLELTALAAEVPAPSRDEVRAAYAAAGFSPDVVEVSQDSTPTGLAVDSIVSAAAVGQDCVLAEIRSGTATVTVVPALANGACLLGDDR